MAFSYCKDYNEPELLPDRHQGRDGKRKIYQGKLETVMSVQWKC